MARRWRFYTTPAGNSPGKEFLDRLDEVGRLAVIGEMRVVRDGGLAAARHLQGDLYEVRASAATREYRVLFAVEGKRGQVLLAVEAFEKKSRATPKRVIDTAARRLKDWRERGRKKR